MLRQESDRQILSEARVIGATTNGAAQFRNLLASVSPDVVIIEEAGEVLEAHVLTAVTSDSSDSGASKHLILIGDHKQLPPKVESYELTAVAKKGYNLDCSIFERLIVAGLPSTTLEVQHRMRPSISDFIRQQTYENLVDHESVKHYPDVKGVCENVIFIDHDREEDGIARDNADTLKSTTTKSNTFEVELTVEVVRFFLLQGYHPSRMVVLTPYLGQLFKIIQRMKRAIKDAEAFVSERDIEELGDEEGTELSEHVNPEEKRKSVRVSSVDNYQGEESDIVIISLVRSNGAGIIGFLKEEQRVNVLLSRAKHGMILIGNSSTFLHGSGRRVWEPILKSLSESNQLKKGLPTFCQLHPDDSPIELCKPEDFRMRRPNCGCSRRCTFRLSCGHACPLMCHPVDQKHIVAQKNCHEPCKRFPPEYTSEHPCLKLCKDKCGPCTFLVGPVNLSCGHTMDKAYCHDVRSDDAVKQLASRCKAIVDFRFDPCGHEVQTTCSNATSASPNCPATCGTVMEQCGHTCLKR